MNNKSKVLIVFLIIIIILLSGVLCFKIMENKDKEDVKTEEKITKIEPKENYNGTLLYSETTGLDKYVRDDKFNEVKKEIPTIEDILDDYLNIRSIESRGLELSKDTYEVKPNKISNESKIFYYAFKDGKNEESYKVDSINKSLANSIFGDRIGNVEEKSTDIFTYDSKNRLFTNNYPYGFTGSLGNYIRIIDLNKKENNYVLKIKIGTVLFIDDNYNIGGIKTIYNETTGEYTNYTKLDQEYTIEDESLLDILEIELKPYNNSYKYVISNITLK
ncbi:MAG: hypothetical protein J6K21_01095 [Bacilli bacterium]|nr:hypothetical protein [Bacilli bacterium]